MQQDNKDLIKYLKNKKALHYHDNVIYAKDAFQVRKISIDFMNSSQGRYESLAEFLEQIDPVEEINKIRQNSITQPIDKSQNPAYTSTSAVVQAPTSIPVPPPIPAPKRISPDDMLDRWMNKE